MRLFVSRAKAGSPAMPGKYWIHACEGMEQLHPEGLFGDLNLLTGDASQVAI